MSVISVILSVSINPLEPLSPASVESTGQAQAFHTLNPRTNAHARR